VHLFGFIIRIYHDAARSSECQNRKAKHWLIMIWMGNGRVKQMSKLYKND